jgi:sulfate adenylyltransferase
LVERVAPLQNGGDADALRLPRVAVRDQIARECINIAYGFFSPLEGFMGRADLDSVARDMRLSSGYVWSIPIVFDLSDAELSRLGVSAGDSLLLTYQGQPLATLDVSEVYSYDREFLARQVYGTIDEAHPGVQRTYAYEPNFLGGAITLVNPPVINPPFDRFWMTPKQLRQALSEQGWSGVVAHQTRNVPHSGHEWLMKGAWLAAEAYGEVGGEHKGILVSAVIGEKKPGDYIDEAIVLAHQRLRDDGFFRPDVHLVSTLLWDMRYAGPREAVFHALVRKNLGCTHHMFGRDHAGVGTYYDTYAAHEIFQQLPDLGIKSVLTREWWYCPACAGVAYEGLCGHPEQRQELSGTFIRSIIQGGVEPAPLTLRPEVLEVVRECAEQYGFGSPFVGDQYLDSRTPVMTMPIVEGFCCTCSGT